MLFEYAFEPGFRDRLYQYPYFGKGRILFDERPTIVGDLPDSIGKKTDTRGYACAGFSIYR
jgi:hypothetical protein